MCSTYSHRTPGCEFVELSNLDWPSDLSEQAVRRNLVIFVGAGVSASCERDGRRPPSWSKLLSDLQGHLGMNDNSEIGSLLVSNRMLDAAALIKHEATRTSRLQDFFNFLRTAVDGRPGHQFAGSAWHEAIVRLEPDLLVTTNYDKILERATSDGFSTHSFDSERIAGEIRRRVPTLMKVHGTIDKIEDVILTRADYTRLRLHGVHALSVLQALLLTRTALLVGYSLGDPDIQLLFENVLGGGTEAPAHYMLTEDSLPEYERDVLRYSYGITPLTYAAGNHADALLALQQLADLVQGSQPE